MNLRPISKNLVLFYIAGSSLAQRWKGAHAPVVSDRVVYFGDVMIDARP